MVVLGGVVFLMREVPLYLTYKKSPPPLGPPGEPRHGPTAGSYGVAVSYKHGTPVARRIDRNVCEKEQRHLCLFQAPG